MRSVICSASCSCRASRKIEKSGKPRSANACVHWSEFRSDDVYRRVELPQQIDVGKCTARLEHGMLIVEAPRSDAMVTPPVSIPISSAAKAA